MGLLDLQPILDAALAVMNACECGDPGAYRNRADSQDLADPVAAADAALLLHILGMLPGTCAEREPRVKHLRSAIDAKSGMVRDDLIQTAGIFSALACFDSPPASPPPRLQPLTEPERIPEFLERLDWSGTPAAAGREAASLYTVLVLSGAADTRWEDKWFQWFNHFADEHSGFYHKGPVTPVDLNGQWTLWPYLAGHASILGTHLYAHRPHPYSWRLVDTLLDMLEINWNFFCRDLSGRETPFVVTMVRSLRLNPHRHEEAVQGLRRFAHRWVRYLNEQAKAGAFQDLAETTRILAGLAELQAGLPGFLRSPRPLRSPLLRAPRLP